MNGGWMSRISTAAAIGTLVVGWLSMALWPITSMAEEAREPSQHSGKSNIDAVLELFTSQGCSSCPAADALMHAYIERRNVMVLSFPVDYWDYLGWKDTLASPKFSERQRAYARARGDGRVYTPQVVVSGGEHVIGSNASAIDAAIQSGAAQLAKVRVPLSARIKSRHVIVEAGEGPANSGTVLEAVAWLLLVKPQTTVKIERGENRGKTVMYYNVVREMHPIGMWNGKPATFEFSMDAFPMQPDEVCMVIMQVGRGGAIIGAAQVEHESL